MNARDLMDSLTTSFFKYISNIRMPSSLNEEQGYGMKDVNEA